MEPTCRDFLFTFIYKTSNNPVSWNFFGFRDMWYGTKKMFLTILSITVLNIAGLAQPYAAQPSRSLTAYFSVK